MNFSIKALIMILLFAPWFSTGAEDTVSARHFVKAGENIFRISLRYIVPMDSLKNWNQLDQNFTVTIGRQLFVAGRNDVTIKDKPSLNSGIIAGEDADSLLKVADSDSIAQGQTEYLPFYSEPNPDSRRLTFSETLQYYYGRSNILFRIILVLNLFFILSVVILLIIILFRRIRKGFDDLKRQKCQERYPNYIAAWLYQENTGKLPDSLEKELKDRVYRDVFTSELLALHANLTGESAEKLVALFHFAGLKKYSILKVQHSSWHVKAKGFRELAQMKIVDGNNLIYNYLNSDSPILQIEAQLAWIQLNPGDPLRFLDDPDIRLTEWALLNTHHSLKKIDPTPDFGRWLQLTNKSVTLFAIKMSGIFKQFKNIELIIQRLQDPDTDIRTEAILALGKMEALFAGSFLIQMFSSEEQLNKSAIIQSLTMIADVINIPFFEEVLINENEPGLRIMAAKGLVSMKNQGIERLDFCYLDAGPVLKNIIIHAKDERI